MLPSHIFEAKITSKKEGKGIGTGLYMSKQISDKMSAALSVKNTTEDALFTLLIDKVKD